MHKTAIPMTLLAVSLLQQQCFAGESISETRPAGADALISIELYNGRARISGWDRDEFNIEGELSDSARGFELLSDNGNIRFAEEHDRDPFFNWRGSRGDEADLEIRVPRGSILRLEGININVEVSELRGNTEIALVNGQIEATALSGVVRLDTVNGEIDARELDGRISLGTVNGRIVDQGSRGERVSYETVNGSIRSDNLAAGISVDNVNGSIELALGNIDELEISTVGGSVDVSAQMNPQAQIEISSVGGGIDLDLPAATSASFHVSTSVGGSIRNRLSADEVRRENRFVNSKALEFVLNGGDGNVKISTVNGSIELGRSDD